MQLFFNEIITIDDTEIIFSKEESRHIVKVLRKAEGDFVFITNGKGILFKAEVSLASTNKCIAQIIEIELQKLRLRDQANYGFSFYNSWKHYLFLHVPHRVVGSVLRHHGLVSSPTKAVYRRRTTNTFP